MVEGSLSRIARAAGLKEARRSRKPVPARIARICGDWRAQTAPGAGKHSEGQRKETVSERGVVGAGAKGLR